MTTHEVTVEACIDAPPETVFSVSADPRKPFLTLNPFITTTIAAVCTVIKPPPLAAVMLLAKMIS